jgi:hypothetical protein
VHPAVGFRARGGWFDLSAEPIEGLVDVRDFGGHDADPSVVSSAASEAGVIAGA